MMRDMDINDLRALIRLIPPLRSLVDEVEKSIHLELYHGTGDLAVRSYRGLRETALNIIDDPYLVSLELDVAPQTDDRQKVAQVMMAANQLLAYIESQAGVRGISAPRGSYSVQTAPNISLDMGDVIGGQIDRVMDVVRDAMRSIPKPPKPPRPPEHLQRKQRRVEVEIDYDDDDDDLM